MAKRNKNTLHYEKGKYGHIKYYRLRRIIIGSIILACILADLFISLHVLHTRKTLFLVAACVIAIPFARNIVDLIMTIKIKPLKREEYEKVHEISKSSKIPFLYDITITDTDGVEFYPVVSIYNNNVVAFSRSAMDTPSTRRAERFMADINEDARSKARIVICSDLKKFEKEVKKLSAPKDDKQPFYDKKMREKLITMGF